MTKRQAELFPGLQSSKKYLSDYPLLVAEWHPTKNGNLAPDDYQHKSGKKVWWKCEYGHEWDARIYSRVNGCGCPYCGHQLASPDNNLTVHYPELISEWHPTKTISHQRIIYMVQTRKFGGSVNMGMSGKHL